MSNAVSAEALQSARRAVARIRAYGIDGPRPIEEIEALLEHGDDIDPALQEVLASAGREELAAAIHLVVLLRREAVLDAVRRAAFERPAGLAAKREALEALRACGAGIDEEIGARVAAIDRMGRRPEAADLDTIAGWGDAWRPPALDAWLGAAGSEQVGAVEAALGREEIADEALLEWLGDRATGEAGAALQRYLAAAGDKRRIKQAKRALHRVRSKGVEVEEPEGAAGGAGGFSLAIDSDPLQDARAYVTSIDGHGARLVWLLWRSAGGGSRLLQAVIDDTAGLREAEIANVTRGGFRDYIQRVNDDPDILLAQVDVPLALGILEDAARRGERTGSEMPSAYREFATAVAAAETAEEAAGRIYGFVAAEQVGGDKELLETSMTLLREPHFQSWALAGPAIDAAAQEVRAAETSTLMISDEQRRERMQAAIHDAVRDTFDDATRALYRRRLELMAAMLWDRGDEEQARRALAAAIGLTEVEDLFHGHAFARALAHRGVWLAYQDRQREAAAEEQRSRLVKP